MDGACDFDNDVTYKTTALIENDNTKMTPAIESEQSLSSTKCCQNTTTCKPSTVDEYCEHNNINRPYRSSLILNTVEFSYLAKELREFFLGRGFLEVSTQNRLSILAACEDPWNVGTFNYAGQCWPLPQTGQMWLEYELLKNPDVAGYFCLTTSYRMEKNPVENRHDLIFPLFEF